MNNASKTGIDAAKTTSKRIVHKTAEATGDLIGNKIVDKITSIDKPKEKETKKKEKIYVPPEKRQQIIDDLRYYNVNKEIRTKTSMLRSNLCDFSDAYIVVKGTITVTEPDNAKKNKAVVFKNNAPFINCIPKINGIKIDNAEDLDVVMPMYNLLEYSNSYKKQQVVYGIIIEMSQVILFLLILNVLNVKQFVQQILIILVMIKKGMMQITLVKKKLKLLFH